MNISDPISLQVFFWLSAVVLVTLIICLCIVGRRFAEAWGQKKTEQALQSDIAQANARVAEANAKQSEMVYQKALLERVGEPPQVTLSIPQDELNKLALAYAKRRIESLKVKIEI